MGYMAYVLCLYSLGGRSRKCPAPGRKKKTVPFNAVRCLCMVAKNNNIPFGGIADGKSRRTAFAVITRPLTWNRVGPGWQTYGSRHFIVFTPTGTRIERTVRGVKKSSNAKFVRMITRIVSCLVIRSRRQFPQRYAPPCYNSAVGWLLVQMP